MSNQCSAVDKNGTLFCSVHNVALTQIGISEIGGGPADMKSFTCPVSGASVLFNANFAPEQF